MTPARLALAFVAFGLAAGEAAAAEERPHVAAADRRVEYAGPGRERPEPPGLDEVRIAYFGPSDPAHPLGGDPWLAASLAVEEANLAGGYRGLPFRLLPSWSESPWRSGISDLARSIYDGGAWAVIGSIDSASTHLAEQVVAKARLPLVNPGGTGCAVNLAGVAWVFSCLPGDDEQARALARAIATDGAPPRLALVSATDHDSRGAAAALSAALSDAGIAPVRHLTFEPGATDFAPLLDALTASGATAVAVVAGALDGARLVPLLAGLDPAPRLFGTQAFARRAFLDRAGTRAGGARLPWPCSASVPVGSFAETFRARFGREADCATVQTYDATRLLIEAIRRAGLNRARIRDAIAALAPWSGESGPIDWDALGRNRRSVVPAELEGGRVVLPAPASSAAVR